MSDAASPYSARQRGVLVAVVLLVLIAAVAAQWWHTRSYARFGAAMAAMAQPGDIHLMGSRDCEGCASARAWLRQYAVAFTECDIDEDARCAADHRSAAIAGSSDNGAGGQWQRDMPAIRVRGELQVGFAPQRIFERLRG